jgi:folate-binding protein YgfZ
MFRLMGKIVDISNERGLIAVSGDDREKFLQGIISNDIRKANGSIIFTFLLTPQGKYIYDLIIFEHEQSYIIECEKHRVDDLLKKLSQYKLRSKVVLENITAQFCVFHVLDGKVEGEWPIFTDPRQSELGKRAYIKRDEAEKFIASNQLANKEEYNLRRIDLLVPEGSFEFAVEGDFPLQFRMNENNGVDFKKGCYVGQEVTARTFHRGTVRKTLFRLKTINGEAITNNDENRELFLGDEKIGRVILAENGHCLANADIEKVESLATTKDKSLIYNKLNLETY